MELTNAELLFDNLELPVCSEFKRSIGSLELVTIPLEEILLSEKVRNLHKTIIPVVEKLNPLEYPGLNSLIFLLIAAQPLQTRCL